VQYFLSCVSILQALLHLTQSQGYQYLPPVQIDHVASTSGVGGGEGEYSAIPSYSFGYAVDDSNSGNSFGHQEQREGAYTAGNYYVLLPDGRKQKVTYVVNGQSGFVAEYVYEGEARESSKIATGSQAFSASHNGDHEGEARESSNIATGSQAFSASHNGDQTHDGGFQTHAFSTANSDGETEAGEETEAESEAQHTEGVENEGGNGTEQEQTENEQESGHADGSSTTQNGDGTVAESNSGHSGVQSSQIATGGTTSSATFTQGDTQGVSASIHSNAGSVTASQVGVGIAGSTIISGGLSSFGGNMVGVTQANLGSSFAGAPIGSGQLSGFTQPIVTGASQVGRGESPGFQVGTASPGGDRVAITHGIGSGSGFANGFVSSQTNVGTSFGVGQAGTIASPQAITSGIPVTQSIGGIGSLSGASQVGVGTAGSTIISGGLSSFGGNMVGVTQANLGSSFAGAPIGSGQLSGFTQPIVTGASQVGRGESPGFQVGTASPGGDRVAITHGIGSGSGFANGFVSSQTNVGTSFGVGQAGTIASPQAITSGIPVTQSIRGVGSLSGALAPAQSSGEPGFSIIRSEVFPVTQTLIGSTGFGPETASVSNSAAIGHSGGLGGFTVPQILSGERGFSSGIFAQGGPGFGVGQTTAGGSLANGNNRFSLPGAQPLTGNIAGFGSGGRLVEGDFSNGFNSLQGDGGIGLVGRHHIGLPSNPSLTGNAGIGQGSASGFTTMQVGTGFLGGQGEFPQAQALASGDTFHQSLNEGFTAVRGGTGFTGGLTPTPSSTGSFNSVGQGIMPVVNAFSSSTAFGQNLAGGFTRNQGNSGSRIIPSIQGGGALLGRERGFNPVSTFTNSQLGTVSASQGNRGGRTSTLGAAAILGGSNNNGRNAQSGRQRSDSFINAGMPGNKILNQSGASRLQSVGPARASFTRRLGSLQRADESPVPVISNNAFTSTSQHPAVVSAPAVVVARLQGNDHSNPHAQILQRLVSGTTGNHRSIIPARQVIQI
ncbi:hypothetical protein SK128_004916, partial [Halocaridina rubra]